MAGARDGGSKERGETKVEGCHGSDERWGGMNDLGWKGGWKWLVSGCILKVKLTELSNGSAMECSAWWQDKRWDHWGSWEGREEEQAGVEVGIVQIRSVYVPDGQMFWECGEVTQPLRRKRSIISISGVQCDSFIYIYTHTQTEKIITIKLINIPITSHSYCSFVCVVRPQRHISLVFFFFFNYFFRCIGSWLSYAGSYLWRGNFSLVVVQKLQSKPAQ